MSLHYQLKQILKEQPITTKKPQQIHQIIHSLKIHWYLLKAAAEIIRSINQFTIIKKKDILTREQIEVTCNMRITNW